MQAVGVRRGGPSVFDGLEEGRHKARRKIDNGRVQTDYCDVLL